MRRSLVLLPLLLLLACSSSSRVENDATASDENNLTGGTAATEGQFPSTLYVRNNCTASKVGPRHILTAAHCVVGEDGSISWIYQTNFDVTTKVAVDNYAPDFAGWIHVSPKQIHLPPGVTAAVLGHQRIWGWGEHADIAIVEVDINDEASTAAFDAIPTASIDTDPLVTDEVVTIQGYGCENGFEGPKDYQNVRLKHQATKVATYELLNQEAPTLTVYTSNYDGRQFFATRGQGRRAEEASLCPGDSGGPVYRGAGAGANRIVGINSRGWRGTDVNEIGTTNAHTRVDAQTQWDVAGWLHTLPGVSLSASQPISSQHFEDCEPVQGRNGEPFNVCGAFRRAYQEGGGVAVLGYPTQVAGLEDHTQQGTRWSQRFEYAVIRESDGDGAQQVAVVDKFYSRCEGMVVGGSYCGPALSDPNKNHLYKCTEGNVPVLTVCEHGCRPMPAGVPDKCEPAPRPDLCAGATLGTGLYCARAFDSTDQVRLLRCDQQRTVDEIVCSAGCKSMPDGVPDQCN